MLQVWSDVELDQMDQKSHILRNSRSANQLRDEAQKQKAKRVEMRIKGGGEVRSEEKVWYMLLLCSDQST